MFEFISRAKSSRNSDLLELSDAELLARYRDQADLQVISVLMHRYQDLIVGIAMKFLKDREEVRDFVSRLYLKLVDKLEQSEVKNARAWLCMVTMNLLRDDNRKGIVREQYRKTLKEEIEWSSRRTEFRIDASLIHQAMAEALSDKEQQVLRAIYFDEKSHREIMDETGWTFNQVRGLRERAVRKLRDRLGNDFSDYLQVS